MSSTRASSTILRAAKPCWAMVTNSRIVIPIVFLWKMMVELNPVEFPQWNEFVAIKGLL